MFFRKKNVVRSIPYAPEKHLYDPEFTTDRQMLPACSCGWCGKLEYISCFAEQQWEQHSVESEAMKRYEFEVRMLKIKNGLDKLHYQKEYDAIRRQYHGM